MIARPPLSRWSYRHVLDLAAFSQEDYATVLELANRFRALPMSGPRRLPCSAGPVGHNPFF